MPLHFIAEELDPELGFCTLVSPAQGLKHECQADFDAHRAGRSWYGPQGYCLD